LLTPRSGVAFHLPALADDADSGTLMILARHPPTTGLTMRTLFLLAILCIATGMATANFNDSATTTAPPPNAVPPPPKTKAEPVTETLHGVQITDPYRWLENGDSPETQQWVREQLQYTRSILDPLPGRDKIRARLEQLLTIGTISAPQVGVTGDARGDWYFFTRREGNQNQPVLYVRRGLKGEERALVDPNKLSADATVALDWWYATEDGKYVAYGTSPSGSEISTLHILETETGKLLPEAITPTRAASLAWLPDNSGFYYTRYPRKGEVAAGEEMYHRRVFFHALGSADNADGHADPLIFGADLPAQDWPDISLSEDGRWLVIDVEHGWTKSELYLKDVKANGAVVPVAVGKDFIYTGEVFGGNLYIRTNEDAPRYRVYRVAAEHPERAAWKEIIPQVEGVLESIGVVGSKLVASYEHNASSELKVFDLDGKQLATPPLPTIGSIDSIGGNRRSPEAFFGFNSYTVPPTVYRMDLNSHQVTMWDKVQADVDASRYEVKQVWYRSKDATRVPMFIVAKKGLKLDGRNPTLLNGYGGFNISLTPAFSRGLYLWLEHGGVFAQANLRGGSEFGEEWHRAGMLDKKQNVFNDFLAAAEYLIAQKYTDRDHLAIQGGSNGGLLMGAALTQRPDLFKAVVCQVPLLDMLRYQRFQIAKLWIPEYGSADDPQQFRWLYAYSPYHHVKDGAHYPAVLFMTAESDTRVDPMHAKKMAARLQAANGDHNPILLRIEPKAGHGVGKPVSKLIDEGTDIWSFLFWQLGIQP
jgi:prolyl oligopeptidase